MSTDFPWDLLWRGRPDNVLGTSQIILPGMSLKRQIWTSPGRHFRTSLDRQIETSPGWSNKIFRGRPGDVGAWRPRDVLGTILAGWVRSELHQQYKRLHSANKAKPLPQDIMPFDVKLLFTYGLLDWTIIIILRRIHDHKKLKILIIKCEMKEMFALCTNTISHAMERSFYKPMALLWRHQIDLR